MGGGFMGNVANKPHHSKNNSYGGGSNSSNNPPTDLDKL